MPYITPDHPDAFIDFPPPPIHPIPEGSIVCARCKGHGGWNLELLAFPRTPSVEQQIRDMLKKMPVNNLKHDMTKMEFRHYYVHFRASCNNCNGWGYVPASQGEHIHNWHHHQNVGNCLNQYKCSTCGEIQTVDSSD